MTCMENQIWKTFGQKVVGHWIIGYLSINSVRNTFKGRRGIDSGNIDIPIAAGTKVGNTFPRGIFSIQEHFD